MKVSKKSLVLTAAFSGLLAGTMSRANAGVSNTSSNPTFKSASSSAVQSVADEKEKHACQGKNSCKGKNSCNGKGGCATDGSKKPGLAA